MLIPSSYLSGKIGAHRHWARVAAAAPHPPKAKYAIPDPLVRLRYEDRVDPERLLAPANRQRCAWHTWQADCAQAELDALLEAEAGGAA